MTAQRPQMGETGFLGFLEITQHRRCRENGGVIIGESEPGGGFRLPLAMQLLLGMM